MRKVVLSVWIALALASGASAQTKISGTVQCGKAYEQHVLPVGDHPNHAFAISKTKCTWKKPLEVGGAQTTEEENTGFSEITGNSSSDRVSVVGAMSNGDKVFVRTLGKSVLKDGTPQSIGGNWTYAGGTGKFKGLKGKGTYKGTPGAGGSMTIEVEGEYQLPQ